MLCQPLPSAVVLLNNVPHFQLFCINIKGQNCTINNSDMKVYVFPHGVTSPMHPPTPSHPLTHINTLAGPLSILKLLCPPEQCFSDMGTCPLCIIIWRLRRISFDKLFTNTIFRIFIIFHWLTNIYTQRTEKWAMFTSCKRGTNLVRSPWGYPPTGHPCQWCGHYRGVCRGRHQPADLSVHAPPWMPRGRREAGREGDPSVWPCSTDEVHLRLGIEEATSSCSVLSWWSGRREESCTNITFQAIIFIPYLNANLQ